MVSVCTVHARGGMSCERSGGYKTINRIPLPLVSALHIIVKHAVHAFNDKHCIQDIQIYAWVYTTSCLSITNEQVVATKVR